MKPAFDPKRIPGDGASLTDRPTAKYVGQRNDSGTTVFREDDAGNILQLHLRHDLRRHAEAFEWGYAGSGPAQLALCILADAIGPADAAACYQQFKFQVIARLPRGGWELTRKAVIGWYRSHTSSSAADQAPETE